MTDKATIKLATEWHRQRAISIVAGADLGAVVSVGPTNRTLDQNALLWSVLGDITEAKPDGRDMTAEQWKCVFMDAAGFKPKFEATLDGNGFICLGYKSSRLNKREFSDLIETIYEFGARKGVQFKEGR